MYIKFIFDLAVLGILSSQKAKYLLPWAASVVAVAAQEPQKAYYVQMWPVCQQDKGNCASCTWTTCRGWVAVPGPESPSANGNSKIAAGTALQSRMRPSWAPSSTLVSQPQNLFQIHICKFNIWWENVTISDVKSLSDWFLFKLLLASFEKHYLL